MVFVWMIKVREEVIGGWGSGFDGEVREGNEVGWVVGVMSK